MEMRERKAFIEKLLENANPEELAQLLEKLGDHDPLLKMILLQKLDEIDSSAGSSDDDNL